MVQFQRRRTVPAFRTGLRVDGPRPTNSGQPARFRVWTRPKLGVKLNAGAGLDLVPEPLPVGPDPHVESVPLPRPFFAASCSLVAELAGLRAKGPISPRSRAEALGRFFGSQGALWIKLAQLLAMRRDLFDSEFCRTLGEMKDRSHAFPMAEVRRIIESDLAVSLDDLFSEFDEIPVASASTGQTHRARLRASGEVVAVKVQRPGLAEALRVDAGRIRSFVTGWGRSALGGQLSWDDLSFELDQALGEALDYRLEATYMRLMRKRLRKHKVYVPRVFSRWSRARVQVKEWVAGEPMSRYIIAQRDQPEELAAWLKTNQIDPEKVGRRIYESLNRQILEESYFHGNWHPGNLILLRRGWVAIVDFWAMTALESSFRRKYALLTQSICDREYTKAADLLLLFCKALPPTVEPETIRDQVLRVLRTFEVRTQTHDIPYDQKSLATALGDAARALASHDAIPIWPFMRVHRAFATIDASLAHLIPRADFLKMTERYWVRARQRAVAKRTSPDERIRGMVGVMQLLRDGPEFLQEQLLFQGEGIRRRAKAFRRTTSKISDMLELGAEFVAAGVLACVFLLVGAYLSQHHPSVPEALGLSGSLGYVRYIPVIDEPLWVILLMVLAHVWLRILSLKRRFAQTEVRTEAVSTS